MSVVSRPSSWRQIPPALPLYLVAIFVLGFTYDGGVYAVLQNLYLLRLGYDPVYIGVFNSTGLFIFALLSLPIGTVRRWTSQQVLLFGIVLIFSGMLIVPVVPWVVVQWQSIWLLVGRVMTMIGLACFFVHSPPFLMSITQDDWQSRALAWQAAVWSISAFLGGLLGGYLPGWFASLLGSDLVEAVPYQISLLLAGLIMISAYLAIARTPGAPSEPLSDPALPTVVTAAASPNWLGHIGLFVAIIALVRILQVAVPGAILTFGNVYLDDGLRIATRRIGMISALGKLVSVPVALVTPHLIARWGSFRLVIGISLVSILAALPLALTHNWLFASFAFVLASGAAPLRYLSFLLFSLSLVTVEQRALVSGAGEMAVGFGFAILALVGGYLIADYSYGAFFALSLALTLAGTGLFWLFFRSRVRSETGSG